MNTTDQNTQPSENDLVSSQSMLVGAGSFRVEPLLSIEHKGVVMTNYSHLPVSSIVMSATLKSAGNPL